MSYVRLKFYTSFFSKMKTDLRTVFHYCFLRGLSVEDTYNEMIIAYGNKVPQPRTIKKWF